MPTLLPAILSKERSEIEEKIHFLESIPEITEVHLDFEDGQFVPNSTALPKDLSGFQTRLKIDAHMMAANPQAYFHDLIELGVASVDLHFESFPSIAELLTAVGNLKAMNFQTAVVVNPETDLAIFKHLVPPPDIMFIMSVHPGFQGRPFLPASLDRLQVLRKHYPDAIIEVDGGISHKNIEAVRAYGADRIVVGSGIWHNLDPKKAIYELLEKLKS